MKIYISTFGENKVIGPVFVSLIMVKDDFFRNNRVIKGKEIESTKNKLESGYIDYIEAKYFNPDNRHILVANKIVDVLNTIYEFWEHEIYISLENMEEVAQRIKFPEKLLTEIMKSSKHEPVLKFIDLKKQKSKGCMLAHKYSEINYLKEIDFVKSLYDELYVNADTLEEIEDFNEYKDLYFIKKIKKW